MTDDRLTDDELAAIAARAEEATPGPWKEEWESDAIYEDGPLTFWPYQIVTETLVVCGFDDSQPTPDDFTFIASARADIPALLAHIRAQDAELARLRDALETIVSKAANMTMDVAILIGMLNEVDLDTTTRTVDSTDYGQGIIDGMKICRATAVRALLDGGA